jgi:predicted XRE-type DNA-binding protein
MYRRSSINKDTGCWEWGGAKVKGYGKMKVKRKLVSVHRMSAAMFLGFDLSSSLFVCHHCDNPVCWNPHHLFIGTQQDNMRDRDTKGRGGSFKGEQNGAARLTEKDVLEIRRRVTEGATQSSIAREFGIAQPSVSDIVNRKKWKHIEEGNTNV